MNWKKTWSRRAFLQGIGYTSVSRILDNWIPTSRAELSSHEYAYVASAASGVATTPGFSGSGIHVFDVSGNDWFCKQRIPSCSPVSLALHPDRHVLYVANEVDEYQGLPRGTVEAYKIDPCDGALAFMNRQPLSLSGINPRHIAISPDGTYLVAAIHGGGAYNVLSIQPNGSLGGVKQILKEVGVGSHPVDQASAHPHTVVFDATGQYLLATDEGCERLSIFTFRNGQLTRTAQTHCPSASGPGHIAMHSSGRIAYISNTLDGSVACYVWGARGSQMQEMQRIQIVSINGASKGCNLTLSPSGGILYATSPSEGISAWEIDPVTGTLSFRQRFRLSNRSLLSLNWSADKKTCFAVDSHQGEILSFPVHAETGELGQPSVVAHVTALTSLLIRS